MSKRRSFNRILVLMLLQAVCMLFFACRKDSTPIINEVCSSNSTAYHHESLGTPDWIEIYNPSSREIDLSGYILTDNFDTYDPKTVLPSLKIPAGGYLVLPVGSESKSDSFCLPFGLSRKGENLYLISPNGGLLQNLAIPELASDITYARREDGSYGYCTVPTPGKKNDTDILNEITLDDHPAASDTRGLMVTEVSSGGSVFVEVYNSGETAASLRGMYLSDDPGKLKKAPIGNLQVQPHGYAAIYCGNDSGNVELGISKNGETVYLADSFGNIVDAVEVPALLLGQTWARDADGVFGYCGVATPGEANEKPIGAESLVKVRSGNIVLSEALFHNTSSIIDRYGDRSDFVELYNGGNETVSLEGYYLTDDFSQLQKGSLDGITMEPGEYRIIFLSGNNSKEGEVHIPFSVGSGDDGIMLYYAQDRSCQMIPYVEGLNDNVSMGIDGEGDIVYYAYPTPGYENATGFTSMGMTYDYPYDDVYISEVSPGGANGEWIELKNGSDVTVRLSDWSLKDDLQKTGTVLPDVELRPGEYYAVATAGFGVAWTGEEIFLVDSTGVLRDHFATGSLEDGMTSGRTGTDSDGARVFYLQATKGKKNPEQCYWERTSEPIIGKTSLYQQEAFVLQVSCMDPNAVLYYTLDGSEPNIKSKVYDGGIEISRSCSVRVMAAAEGKLSSRIITATYLFVKEHTLPVVTISTEPKTWKKLSSQNHKDKNALKVQVGYYVDGRLETSFPADMNMRGNSSTYYPQKSYSVHLRSGYGQGEVSYPFWDEKPGLSYSSFVLRNGGQDYNSALIRDSFANRAASGLQVITVMNRPVIVYVNGEYYGIMSLNECMNQDYYTTHYGIEGGGMNMVMNNDTVRTGSAKELARLRKYARTKNFKDNTVLETFAEEFDVDATMDFLIAQTFFADNDVQNNLYVGGTGDNSALKWQAVLYDEDRCFIERLRSENLFEWYFDDKGVTYGAKNVHVNMDIFSALRKNKDWSNQFVERYAYLLSNDFSVERLQGLVDEMAAEIRPEVEQHVKRWKTPVTMELWEERIQSMKNVIKSRHALIQKQIRAEFGISINDWNTLMEKYSGERAVG